MPDVVRALGKRGYTEEAENLLLMLRQRISGDYLQTSALVRDGRVLSAINDPNDYRGPGTGYRMPEPRWQAVQGIRNVITRERVLAAENVVGQAVGQAAGEAHRFLDHLWQWAAKHSANPSDGAFCHTTCWASGRIICCISAEASDR